MCTPGEIRCADTTSLERCGPTGKLWLQEPCPSQTTCMPCASDSCTTDYCAGPCESIDELPSSAGCSFIANRQLEAVQEIDDGLVVANPNSTASAHVIFMQTPEGTHDEEVLEEIDLEPLESHAFRLTTNFLPGTSSAFRTGGTYRVQSDVPIVAYHHAPYQLANGNDSSLLLPETSLRQEYIAVSYGPNVSLRNGEPSYFEVVALENFTTLEWFPPVATAGNGLPVPFVAAGGRGTLKLNRFDTVRIAASGEDQEVVPLRDISGTLIRADKPIWVTTGTGCGRVPTRDLDLYPDGFCDPLQEMAIPLEYWGHNYVAAHSPVRTNERHWWRVYAGTDGVEIELDPPQSVGTISLDKRGDFVDFAVPSGTHFVMHSDNGAFMPVEYLESRHWGGSTNPEPTEDGLAEYGDSSMYQMVPTEQFLSRYVFSTAIAFPFNYVQVIRTTGGSDVVLNDSIVVSNYESAGADFEVATVTIEEGTHIIESGAPFGILQIGYSSADFDPDCMQEVEGSMNACISSYAYPGGMNSDPIYIP